MTSPTKTRRPKGDVHWHAPGRKTPIAYSTVATSRLIGLLAEDGHTFESARAELRYDQDGVVVVDAFIALGHGAARMADLGVRY